MRGGMHARVASRLIVVSLLVASLAHAAPQGETQKIEALIALVADLKDAVFVRNGKDYDCREAAKHMRDKWKWKQDEMKTPRDFSALSRRRRRSPASPTGSGSRTAAKSGAPIFSRPSS
jgi:hypothetical protein